ncbi:MAG TPA: medium chain dehydrogenase/reductase family protein [Symbiobacteriaceae bacterium]|jgi:NADPH2:quinone reductase
MMIRRVVITRHGGPEVLQVVQEPVPEPAPGSVRVRVLVTGVSFADILMRHGLYPGTPPLPFAPGYDIVGVVDKLGPGVAGLQPGQRVAALTVYGGYAEVICLPADRLIPVPEGVDPAEAVSLVLNYVTAYQMLHRVARVKAGDRVLIHGAAGGAGTALLQLGRLAGLTMYGTASAAKHPLVAALGGIPIDYRREDFVARVRSLSGDGVDAVFDPIGGANFWRSYRTLRPGGRLVAYGMSAALEQGRKKLAAGALGYGLLGLCMLLPGRKAGFYDITGVYKDQPGWFREDLTSLFGLLAEKQIQPVIAERLPLAEAARAQELVSRAAVSGKVVLVCSQ